MPSVSQSENKERTVRHSFHGNQAPVREWEDWRQQDTRMLRWRQWSDSQRIWDVNVETRQLHGNSGGLEEHSLTVKNAIIDAVPTCTSHVKGLSRVPHEGATWSYHFKQFYIQPIEPKLNSWYWFCPRPIDENKKVRLTRAHTLCTLQYLTVVEVKSFRLSSIDTHTEPHIYIRAAYVEHTQSDQHMVLLGVVNRRSGSM